MEKFKSILKAVAIILGISILLLGATFGITYAVDKDLALSWIGIEKEPSDTEETDTPEEPDEPGIVIESPEVYEDFVFSGNELVSYIGDSPEIEIPSSYSINKDGQFIEGDDYIVTSIADDELGIGAFKESETLTSVTLPNTVTRIGNYAFTKCYNLEQVIFEDGSELESLGICAFNYCESLTEINLPETLNLIGVEAFSNCNALTEFVLPKNVKIVSMYAFRYCSLVKFEIPMDSKLEYIGRYAFSSNDFTELTLPACLKEIGENAFSSVDIATVNYLGTLSQWNSIIFENRYSNPCNSGSEFKLNGEPISTTLIFPEDINKINNNAFAGFPISIVELNSNIEEIGDYAFANSNLTSIEFNDNIKYIGKYAFSSTDLAELILPASITKIDENAFNACSSLETVNYLGTLSQWLNIEFVNQNANPISRSKTLSIDEGVIENLVIPEGVTAIKPYAFYGCTTITSITLPSTITSIGDGAFYILQSNVIINSEVPPTLGSNAIHITSKIQVPAESVEVYKTAWTSYADKIEAIASLPIVPPESGDIEEPPEPGDVEIDPVAPNNSKSFISKNN